MRRFTNPVAIALVLTAAAAWPSQAQGPWPEPWHEPQDTAEALFFPDHYAWRVFVAINWPARVERREADPAKPLGTTGATVWETWRSVNSDAPDAIFLPAGQDPGPWIADQPVQVALARSVRSLDRPLSVRRLASAPQTRRTRAPSVQGGQLEVSEVRYNKAAFEFVRARGLFKYEGIRAGLQEGVKSFSLPPAAKVIKSQWRVITEAEKPRYHWAEVTLVDGSKKPYGLIALHVTTKDIPNWLWMTFEHVDNRTPGRNSSGDDNPGWQLPTIDRFACPAPPHTCGEAPRNIGLEGTKWANYRLRGTQIDYIDSWGEPTRLSNSIIEKPEQNSSCISCHAKATAGSTPGEAIGESHTDLGPPKPEWFKDADGKQKFIQTDFLWSLGGRPALANP